MVSDYSHFSDLVRQLRSVLDGLEADLKLLGLRPLAEHGWYGLLTNKLLPQLADEPFLVVAVVGGTNIGKSVIFNHLVGEKVSSSSPFASGTKHPTVCFHPGFAESRLPAIFQEFELRPVDTAEDALRESDRHLLFYRSQATTPRNLLVLDTPDIDSDAKVNWERADKIRQTADVLMVVLTQQKYNDAAVKEFFRKAANEDKVTIVIFNQCLLPDDEEYWPSWLGTFCEETGLSPEFVYLAPHDRRAADGIELKFQARSFPPVEHSETVPEADQERAVDLMEDISTLRFEEIKLRTFRGAMRELLSHEQGIPKFQEEISRKCFEFQQAINVLAAHELAEIDNWPTVPNKFLIGLIRQWWLEQREGWSARVHGFYNTVGTGLLWPAKMVHRQMSGPPDPPLQAYKEKEWLAIVKAVEKAISRLNWLRELGNELLKPRLDELLSGQARETLIDRLRAAHEETDLEKLISRIVEREMATFEADQPRMYSLLKKLDMAAAAARPATSVALFVTGFGPIGHVVSPFVADAAAQTMLHAATDVTAGAVTATVGETAISSTASKGAGYVETKFRRLHETIVASRAQWLAGFFESHLLQHVTGELTSAAEVVTSERFEQLTDLTKQLREWFEELTPARGEQSEVVSEESS